jgi:hypothetical protein
LRQAGGGVDFDRHVIRVNPDKRGRTNGGEHHSYSARPPFREKPLTGAQHRPGAACYQI